MQMKQATAGAVAGVQHPSLAGPSAGSAGLFSALSSPLGVGAPGGPGDAGGMPAGTPCRRQLVLQMDVMPPVPSPAGGQQGDLDGQLGGIDGRPASDMDILSPT